MVQTKYRWRHPHIHVLSPEKNYTSQKVGQPKYLFDFILALQVSYLVGIFQAEKTHEQRIDKLLYYIKRRGEGAFDNFIAAIRIDPVYETLATDLEAEYAKEHAKLSAKPGKYIDGYHNICLPSL